MTAPPVALGCCTAHTTQRETSMIKFASTIHVLPTTTAYACIVGCCNHMQERGPRCRWRCALANLRLNSVVVVT